jgi:hypothetical protein
VRSGRKRSFEDESCRQEVVVGYPSYERPECRREIGCFVWDVSDGLELFFGTVSGTGPYDKAGAKLIPEGHDDPAAQTHLGRHVFGHSIRKWSF